MNIYGFLIGLAIYIGIVLFQNKHHQIRSEKLDQFYFFLVFWAILGARLYHVFDFWFYYQHHLIQIFNLPAGGLGIFGAIISSFIYLYIYAAKNNLILINLLNCLTPSVVLGQSIGRIGNYFNTEIFGKPTYIDIGQYIPPQTRPNQYIYYKYFHPVWLYESVLLFLLYLIVRKSNRPFKIYLIGYGLIRLTLEFLRFDTWQIANVKLGQIISIIFIIIGLLISNQSQTHEGSPNSN